MNNILEDLFSGQINVAESLPVRKRKEISGEELFTKSLTPEQQKTYQEILDSILQQWGLQVKDGFIAGFKMAIRMILESIRDTSEEVESEK